jgi:DNA topoisomerase IB
LILKARRKEVHKSKHALAARLQKQRQIKGKKLEIFLDESNKKKEKNNLS